jgi:uncharacterized protein YifE (UPF0438 family)
MTAQWSLGVILFFLPMWLGCMGGTKWEPVAERVCQKYQERVTLLQSVHTANDAKEAVASNERWQLEYEQLIDQFANTLRKYEGAMDFPKYNEFRNRWTQIDESVNRERKRIDTLNGVGTEYDTDLLLISRTSFTNPFR